MSAKKYNTVTKLPVLKPAQLVNYARDEKAVITLSKSLFWDMQLGSDGIQSALLQVYCSST